MGIVSFFKEAGEKLFGRKEAEAAATQAQSAPDPAAAQAKVAELNKKAGEAIATYIASQNLSAEGLKVTFDGATSTVSLEGVAADQATKEKIVLAAGNVDGVGQVDDRLTVKQSGAGESKFYTVEKGDTLSKIAKQFYGDANAYQKIFEANQPMLKHPDKIYPGQQLRIPA